MYYMETGCYCFFYIIKPDKVNYEVRQNPKMLVLAPAYQKLFFAFVGIIAPGKFRYNSIL